MKRKTFLEEQSSSKLKNKKEDENLFEQTIKDFQNNKITKKYLWNETILEHLGEKDWIEYLEKENSGLISFEKARYFSKFSKFSIAIEAAIKIYSEKINSLYEETQKASRVVFRSTKKEIEDEEEEIDLEETIDTQIEQNPKKKRKFLLEKSKKIEDIEENLYNLFQKTFYSSFISDGKIENGLMNKLQVCPTSLQMFYDIKSSVKKSDQEEEEILENQEFINLSENDLPLEIFNFSLERTEPEIRIEQRNENELRIEPEKVYDDAGTQNSQIILEELQSETVNYEEPVENPMEKLQEEFERTIDGVNDKIEEENKQRENKRQKLKKKKVKRIHYPKINKDEILEKRNTRNSKSSIERTPRKKKIEKLPEINITPIPRVEESVFVNDEIFQPLFESIIEPSQDEIPQTEPDTINNTLPDDTLEIISERKNESKIEDIKKYKEDFWKEIQDQELEVEFSKLKILNGNLSIGFVTLLHLASENNLQLNQTDLSDIIIKK